ncbi:hypothetical protein C9374_004445 [Naegleria lovaniensis]|uniref:Uncharacterized protein n=1 Tax=Naegleria lovaniensis TaxID=51637 RepID=A0AA88GRE5_NAELO|nr:uncharacterized protein C9374_004445 [Naegleria lovaniensis]KAG2383108.1 hypothetical protein C9374_004445 [Naegleria lovaniensis]
MPRPHTTPAKKRKTNFKTHSERARMESDNTLALPKLFRPKHSFTYNELLTLFRSCFKETEEERSGNYSVINQSSSMTEGLPIALDNPNSTIENFETLITTVEQILNKNKNAKQPEEYEHESWFPVVTSKYYVSLLSVLSSQEKNNLQELCSLLQILEFGCFSIQKAFNSYENERSGSIAEHALTAKVFVRHLLCLSLALEKLETDNGSMQKLGVSIEPWLHSLCSFFDHLNDLIERKLLRLHSCLEVLRICIPKLLRCISSFGKKNTRVIWESFEPMLLQTFAIGTDFDENEQSDISENHCDPSSSYSTCLLVFDLVKDNLIDAQSACNWMLRSHDIDSEYLFQILYYLLWYCKARLANNEKNHRKLDVSSVVEVFSLVAKARPQIMNLFVEEMSFLNCSNGSVRKYLLEVLASCAYLGTGVVNLTCLNFIINRTDDKDGFVRSKAFQTMSEVCGKVVWRRENEQLFSSIVDCACKHVFDKTKTARVAAIDCLTSLISNNPFTKNFSCFHKEKQGELLSNQNNFENDQNEGMNYSSCHQFLSKIEDLMPKLFDSLRFVVSAGPSMMCKDSLISIFKLLQVIKQYNMFSNWSCLIALVHPEMSDVALKEIASFFAADFMKGRPWILIMDTMGDWSQLQMVDRWAQVIKTLKTLQKDIHFAPIVEQCNQYAEDPRYIWIMLVLSKVDKKYGTLINTTKILQNLESAFKDKDGNGIKASVCLRLLEFLCKTDTSLVKWTEEFIEKYITELLFSFPDETVSLIFSLPNNRRTAYYGIGKVESELWKEWSEGKAVPCAKMVSFCKIIGDICFRSCQEIKTIATNQFIESSESMMIDEDHDGECETDSCVKENQKEQTKNLLIQKAIDETMVSGFLSRYVLLLKNILNSNTTKYVKSFAVLALGKIMLVCRSLALEIYCQVVGCLKSIFTTNEHHLICSCLVVLADAFSVLPTEAEDNNDLILKYVKHENKVVADTAKRLVQDLFTRKKCKASLQTEALDLGE